MTRTTKKLAYATALLALGGLGACISIPQRAWANGEAMSASRASSRALSGDMSFRTHRELQSSLNPLRLNYREVAYPGFPKNGTWW